MTTKQPAGPAMTLGNMRELGVQNLAAYCLNDACRHVALVDVSSYPANRFRAVAQTQLIISRSWLALTGHFDHSWFQFVREQTY